MSKGFGGIDWNEAWMDMDGHRRPADNKDHWNNRAPSFQKTAGTSPYAAEFLELAGVRPGETIFDMGCGSGTLALPLADKGHRIYGGDFSPVMLELMMRRAEMNGTADLITTYEMAWDEDWDKYDIPVCDLAFASRSIATRDLESAILKLNSKARRRVCLTLSYDVSPRIDSVLMKAIGREFKGYAGYMYCMNILWSLGLYPELRFIESKRAKFYDSFDDAIEKDSEIMECTPQERKVLEEYAHQHLQQVEIEEGMRWSYDHQRKVRWAFISWNK